MLKILVWILAFPSIMHAQNLYGVAKNEDGKTVYTEEHSIEWDSSGLAKKISVSYKKPDGSEFAKMTSDFSIKEFLPATTFEDTRFEKKSTLSIVDKSVEFVEYKGESVVSKKSIPLKSGMVASQGFDNFVRKNFDQIKEKPLDFEFGVLEQQDFYNFNAVKMKSEGNEEVKFTIQFSSFFLSTFLPKLEVTYDEKTKRLKRFVGMSNILNDKGKSQKVTIDYQWKEKT